MFSSSNAMEDKDLIEINVVVNLKSDSGPKYLDLSLAVPKSSKNILSIKNKMIMLFSTTTYDQLATRKGKEKVMNQFKENTGIKTSFITRFFLHSGHKPFLHNH